MTDIVVLVVAADDGPLQTTEEAIRQARRAHATIIVAINKIDAENADIPAAKAKLEPLGLKVCEGRKEDREERERERERELGVFLPKGKW